MQPVNGARQDGRATSSTDGPQGPGGEARARILLIEDEPGIVDFVRRGLEAEGFSVEAAMDGIEGERLALKEEHDAVVLDLMLPGRGGLEILPRCAAPGRASP